MKKFGVKRRKNILLWLISADLIMILVMMSFTLAYFTSFDEVTNRFTASAMNIALYEREYDALSERQRSTLIPNRLLPKDPRIQNTEKTDVFVFIKVTVPVYPVTNVNDDGTIFSPKQNQEIFFLKTEEKKDELYTSFHTKQDENDTEYWIEIGSYEEGTDHSGSTRTYIFGYSVYLKIYEITETLFDYIELKNIRQFEVGTSDMLNVTVEAYGIQADSLDGIEKNNGSVKAVMTEEQLLTIYSYIEEPDGSGNDTG